MATVTFRIKVEGQEQLREVSVESEDLAGAIRNVNSESAKLDKSSSSFAKLRKAAAGIVSVTAVLGALKSGIETIAGFERANSELASVLGTTTDKLDALAESAKLLGRTTEFTASDVTSLQTSLARLGFDKGQILDMSEPVLKFASAVGTDLASAADFAGSALRSFGLRASDSQALLDIMAASTSKSALSYSKLAESISTVGPVANAFGLKAQDAVSMLGILSNAGFDASSAATALRNILLNLADANGKLVGGLGHTARTMPEIIDALKELRDRGIDLNSTLEMTDKRSVAAFAALVAGADDVESLNRQLNAADGTLNTMYTTMTDNVQGAMNNLKSAWEGFALAFSESKGVIKDVLMEVADGINGVTDLLSAKSKSSDAKAQGESLMARMFGANGDTKAIGADINGQVKAAEDAVAQAQASLERTVGAVQKSAWKKRLAEAKFNLDMLLAAREDYYQRLKWMDGTYYDAPSVDPNANAEYDGGGSSTTKGIGADIETYRNSVQRAIEVNRLFGGGTTELTAKMTAMKSGITALIGKYGAESDQVKELIREYRLLKEEQLKLSEPLPSVDYSSLVAPVKSDKVEQLRTKTEKFYKTLAKGGEVAGSFGQIGQAISSVTGALNSSAASWANWSSSLLMAISGALPAIASLVAAHKLKANAEVEDAAAGAAASVAFTPIVGPIMAAAAVASVVAALMSIPKFAAGGIAYGPTLGLFGEYSGASTNPEVVAPLDKLKDLVGVGAAGTGGQVDFKIRGRDLVGILNNATNLGRRS